MSQKLLNYDFLWIFLLSLIGLISCKKDPIKIKEELIGDKEIFIGKWNWAYTDHNFGWCDNESYFEVLTPLTENTSFSINFIDNGIMYFYKDQILINEFRLNFSQFEVNNFCNLQNAHQFNIDLNNVQENYFNGCINSDTMRVGTSPAFLFQEKLGCENYNNFFVKE